MPTNIETLISEALAGRTLATRELQPAQIKAIAETLAPIVAQAQIAAVTSYAEREPCRVVVETPMATLNLVHMLQATAWDEGFLADTLMQANCDMKAPANPYRTTRGAP